MGWSLSCCYKLPCSCCHAAKYAAHKAKPSTDTMEAAYAFHQQQQQQQTYAHMVLSVAYNKRTLCTCTHIIHSSAKSVRGEIFARSKKMLLSVFTTTRIRTQQMRTRACLKRPRKKPCAEHSSHSRVSPFKYQKYAKTYAIKNTRARSAISLLQI